MTGTWDLLPKRRSSTSFPRTRDRNPQPPSAWTAALGRTGRRYPAPDAPRADPTRRDHRHRQRRARWMDPGGSPHGARPPAGRAADRAPRRRDDPLHLCEPPGAVPGDRGAARRGPGPPPAHPRRPRGGAVWLVDRSEGEAAGPDEPVEGGARRAVSGQVPGWREPPRGPAPDGAGVGADRHGTPQAGGGGVLARRSHPPGPGALRRDAHGSVSPHLGGHGVSVGPGARGRYAPDPEGERHRRPLRPRTPPLAWGGAREGARIAGWTSSVSTASPRAPSGSPVNAPSTSRPEPEPTWSP